MVWPGMNTYIEYPNTRLDSYKISRLDDRDRRVQMLQTSDPLAITYWLIVPSLRHKMRHFTPCWLECGQRPGRDLRDPSRSQGDLENGDGDGGAGRRLSNSGHCSGVWIWTWTEPGRTDGTQKILWRRNRAIERNHGDWEDCHVLLS